MASSKGCGRARDGHIHAVVVLKSRLQRSATGAVTH